MNWTNFENAIQAQVVTGSGISAGKNVFWGAPNIDRKIVRPFISMSITNLSGDQFPEVKTSMNPTPTPGNPSAIPPTVGNELILTTQDHLEINVKLIAYTDTMIGDSCARAMLQAVKKHFQKGSVVDALESLTESVAVLEVSGVQDASIVLETELEGRAVLDLNFRINDVGEETTTIIETAEITGTVSH